MSAPILPSVMPPLAPRMTRVLFVCHGNICRSPMAQCIFQNLVDQAGLAHDVEVDSAAMTSEEIGNPIYPPARDMLRTKGVPVLEHRARLLRKEDGSCWDYILGMDGENMRGIHRILPHDSTAQVERLLDLTDDPADVDDPWYTDDFATAYQEIHRGCVALLARITGKAGIYPANEDPL